MCEKRRATPAVGKVSIHTMGGWGQLQVERGRVRQRLYRSRRTHKYGYCLSVRLLHLANVVVGASYIYIYYTSTPVDRDCSRVDVRECILVLTMDSWPSSPC